ncbi:NEL-type E3 ubiquitin ligase domain-containing protein [Pseudomonas sp. BJa5]|uniref:NEL-type E3 ubiquitin ligase domain-containing protein n=1 Tax=Pseudomonas sp. BJa5 TaxID=2936270 RepID=UPI00255990E7|nr:NEL-type E3 ubiquitin ligase domain-containing protein [Pseudomonas sp. BGr12]MDL2423045.1 hypothetical protein [Pseudomonas sp. BGr12]
MSSITPALSNPTDAFLGEIMPAWLKNASATRINALRDRFAAHSRTQERLRNLMRQVSPLDSFARRLLEPALETQLGLAVDLRQAQWREVLRDFIVQPMQLPEDRIILNDQPALLRLLQNFPSSPGFYLGTGLIAVDGTQRMLSDEVRAIADLCRAVDVGQRYQAHLDQVFDSAGRDVLAQDKRHGLGLAACLAALKGQISDEELQQVLQVVDRVDGESVGRKVRVQLLQVLECRIEGALVFELRDTPDARAPRSVILYLPQDPGQVMRRFDSWDAITPALTGQLRRTSEQLHFSRSVTLDQRPAFLSTLTKRLADDVPDLQIEGAAYTGELFTGLAQQQVQQVKDNARSLAVPTDTFDHKQFVARIRSFEAAGLNLLNLIGLFVPALNAVLLARMVGQTLGEVYEGVAGWARGHQTEALEHLLGVAENLAVTAVQVAGAALVARGFQRSSFVEALQPVELDAQTRRLWHNDLHAYRLTSLPEEARLQANGLYGADGRHWWQDGDACYEVRQAQAHGQWRLVHPEHSAVFLPALQHNGERGWRLFYQRPLEWQGSSMMLGYLWPHAAALGVERITQVLRVADVDEELLRGLLVENRRLPVSLRDTLERFAVDERIDTFFQALADGDAQGANSEFLTFCLGKVGAQGQSSAWSRDKVLEQAPWLRNELLEHFSRQYLRDDALLPVVKRAFPGLPDAYGLHLLEQASAGQRLRIAAENRLPLGMLERARPLLQAARLNRALEGLYVRNSFNLDTVELVFELLRKKARWPESVNLKLYSDAAHGPSFLRMFPEHDPTTLRVLRHRAGRFEVQDHQGFELEADIADPADVFETMLALLPTFHRQRLGWEGGGGAGQLRQDLQHWLPATRSSLARILGMREFRPWFEPGQRLADGRVGYRLSGRGTAALAQMTIRDRVRSLFPGFDPQQVDAYLADLHREPGTAFDRLLWQEGNYRALDQHLSQWVAQGASTDNPDSRATVADALRRCWRRQGDIIRDNQGRPSGMRLDLAGMLVHELPELPERVDFSHVDELNLSGMGLRALPQDFIQRFKHLHGLILQGNELDRVPAALANMTSLRELRLGHNHIELNEVGVAYLSCLTQLRVLDLSFNNLASNRLEVGLLRRLHTLRLRSTRLQRLPHGLMQLPFLREVDLRDNLISTLPQVLIDRPIGFRQRIHLEGNPLPDHVWRALGEAHVEPVPQANLQVLNAKALWLAEVDVEDRSQRALLWDQLQAEPDSGSFFQLIGELTGTSDYHHARDDLSRRVWEMFELARDDEKLRNELFSLAASPRTCGDSIISCFSELEVKVYVAQALHDVLPEQGRQVRLRIARRLFRLDQVGRLARADIDARLALHQEVDEVEVSLAYRTGLAAELDLPGQPRTMLYRQYAGVTYQQLAVALAQVRNAEASDALVQYISQRDFWQHYLRTVHGEGFERVEQPFWDRLDALSDAQQEQDSASYLGQANRLASEREAAIAAEYLRLTRAALEAEPSGRA